MGAECDKLLKVGGLFIVYHKYIMPNPNPEKYEVAKEYLLEIDISFAKSSDLF